MKPLTRVGFNRLRRRALERSAEAPGYRAMAQAEARKEKLHPMPRPQEVRHAIGEINAAAGRKEATNLVSHRFTSQPLWLRKTDALLWMAPNILTQGNRQARGAWADVIEERFSTAELLFKPKTEQGYRITEMRGMVTEKVQEMLKEHVITKTDLKRLSAGRPHLKKMFSKLER